MGYMVYGQGGGERGRAGEGWKTNVFEEVRNESGYLFGRLNV